MRYIQIRVLTLLIAALFCSNAVRAQSYVDKMLSHQITLNYPDHTVVASVKPVEMVSIESAAAYYWFSGNQINTTQGGYSGKLLNGKYQDFYLNKNLKEAGWFDKGLKSGLWKSWTENGILKDEYTFNAGAKNGDYVKYDTIGKVFEKGSFKQDLLSGKQERVVGDSTVTIYYQQGKIKERKSILPAFIKKILNKDARPIRPDSVVQQPDGSRKISNIANQP